jgi:hypothetical protein
VPEVFFLEDTLLLGEPFVEGLPIHEIGTGRW